VKVSVIIPAYNEEKRIGRTLEKYSLYFENLRKSNQLDYEILVVINNTTDRTEEIVKKSAEKNKRINFLNLKPGGKGYAIREGFRKALDDENDLIGFVDADMSTLPEDFYFLIRKIGRDDGIIASRYVKGSVVKPRPSIQRTAASRVFNVFIRGLLFMPYRDTQCGAKLFKTEALKKTISDISMSQWAFDVDLLYCLRKRNYKIKEVPTRWSDREYSKINFMQAGPLMALAILRLRLINSPFKSFIRIYNFMFNSLKNIG